MGLEKTEAMHVGPTRTRRCTVYIYIYYLTTVVQDSTVAE
jgi:hypothetical protein